MNKKHKTTFKTYAAWDFEKEEEEFNQMSEKGWQLTTGGCFHQKYEFDDSVVYRYRIDFNNKIPDKARYDETFREMGWERISSTFNDWHIFRKKYDPSLPAEEYEIYTDTQSRNEMLKRWRNFSMIITTCVAITAINPLSRVFNEYNAITSIAIIMMYVFMAIMLINAFVGINNLINGKKNNKKFNYNLFMSLFVLSLVILVASAFIESSNFYFGLGILCGFLIVFAAVVIKSIINK